MNGNKKLVVNTGILFIRVILTLIISLITTRFVLKALGEQDFGIYNLVAGIVTLLSFLSTSLSSSTQRFISYEHGRDSSTVEQIRSVVSCSISLHIWASILVFIIVLLGGFGLIEYVLNIPEGKFLDAYYVLGSVAIGLVGTLLSVPFEAILLSRENIVFYAICQLVSSGLRLLSAISIPIFGNNPLIVYSILTAIIPFVTLICEFIYCNYKYEESRNLTLSLMFYSFPIWKKMISFISYTTWGTIGWAVRSQGFSIILNIYWGVIVNAANGIATQVSHAITTFSNSLTTSLRPQLVESIAAENNHRAQELIVWSCKFPALLVASMVIPVFITLPFLLKLWLSDVPSYTIGFCKILLLSLIINQSTVGLCMYLDATGNVKKINLYTGISLFSFTMLAYMLGYVAKSPLIVSSLLIINDVFISILRIRLGCRQGLISYKEFLEIVFSLFLVCILTYIPASLVWHLLDTDFLSLLLIVIISVIVFITVTYVIALNNQERTLIKSYINKLVKV